jgi:hypothetical protein
MDDLDEELEIIKNVGCRGAKGCKLFSEFTQVYTGLDLVNFSAFFSRKIM